MVIVEVMLVKSDDLTFDVVSNSLGIQVASGVMHLIVKQNSYQIDP